MSFGPANAASHVLNRKWRRSPMSQQLEIELEDHHRELLGKTIPEALDWAALRWGDRPAFSFVDRPAPVLTYRGLASAVGRLRSGLESAGLRPGDRVGILLPNQVEFPVTWLAVIDAGAVAVPLNPRYTLREIEFVLDDVDAKWIVTTDDILAGHAVQTFAKIPPANVVVVGETPPSARSFGELAEAALTPRQHAAHPLDLIGIQFTSGSTGLPKGCMLTHTYWVESGAYSGAAFGDPQHLLADRPFFYMQNQAYFFLALAGGGQMHVTPGMSRSKFIRWLVENEIDFAWFDKGLLELLETPADRQMKVKRVPIGGIAPELHRPLELRFGVIARDQYASTELNCVTLHPWDRDDLVGTGTMGLAYPHRETKIVDAELHEVPAGQPGELLVRGPGIMLGYWNRPDANAELMLPDGWFRTGDVVRKTADGFHYYIGRVRDIIRRSGENISAVEVEQQIQTFPGVDEVAVVPVPDGLRGEEVKAIIVVHDGVDVSAATILEWARERLAPFKVPRYIEFRPRLPHLANEKIAKAELKAEPPLTPNVIDTVV
jgi:acyl-CoA synthetase (AMP-forming)/AMP-acid ligase II